MRTKYWILATAMIILTFAAAAALSQGREARQLEIKIIWSQEGMQPIPTATVVLMDENSVVLGIQEADDKGLTLWAHPENKKFQVAVLVRGETARTFNQEKIGSYDKLILAMPR